MSVHMPGSHHSQVLYQADPNALQNLKAIRDRVHHICHHHANQHVRIQTMDGHVYEGVLVKCEGGLLYLSVPHHHAGHRPVSPYYYNNVILPLVLYELLVITLMLL